MSAGVLSREELDALRETMPSAASPSDLDLASGDRGLRRVVPRVEKAKQPIAARVSRALITALRCSCAAQIQSVSVIGPRAGAEKLEQQAMLVELHLVPNLLAGFVGFDCASADAAIEAIFGGAPAACEPTWQRSSPLLTPVERRAVQPVLAKLATDVVGAIKPGLDGIHIAACLEAPEWPGRVDAGLMIDIEIQVGTARGTLTTVLLPAALELPADYSEPDASSTVFEVSATQIQRVAVHVAAILGSVQLSLGDLLALRPGDLLRLSRGKNEPIPVCVEGIPKFLGRPVQRSGCFGVEIESEVP